MCFVGQNEAAGARNDLGLVESEHGAGAQDDIGDAVTADASPLWLRQILDIEDPFDRLDRSRNIAGRDAQVIVLRPS